MNCERCQVELEDFLYGEMAAEQAAELRKHLNGCVDCRRQRDVLEREAEVFARYYEQTALDPSPATWEAIRRRIVAAEPLRTRSEPRAWLKSLLGGSAGAWLRRPTVVRQVAGAVALIVVSVAVTTWLVSRPDQNRNVATDLGHATPTPTGEVKVPPPSLPSSSAGPEVARVDRVRPSVKHEPAGRSAPLQPRGLSEDELIKQQIARTEREYVSAIRMLGRAIAKRKDTIDPSAFAQFESSLALIDQSIEKSREALHTRPGDPAAGQFLLAAYARKVELMQEVAIQ